MTSAGFVCADGLVVAADAAHSSGIARWEQRRIFEHSRPSYALAVCGAGNDDLIRMAFDQLARELEDDDGLEELWRKSEKLVQRIAKKYLFCYAEQARERPQLQLLIAASARAGGSLLLKSDANRLVRVDGCEFVGTGAELARATASWLYEPKLTCAVVAPIAAETLGWVRRHLPGCGGALRVVTLQGTTLAEVAAPSLAAGEADAGFFWGVHRLLQPILTGCLDERVSDVEFDDRLRWFEEALSAVRQGLKRTRAPASPTQESPLGRQSTASGSTL